MLIVSLNKLAAEDPLLSSSVEKYGALAGSTSPYYVLMKNYNIKVYPEVLNVFLIVSGMTFSSASVIVVPSGFFLFIFRLTNKFL